MITVATKAELTNLARLGRASERRERGQLLVEGPRLLHEALRCELSIAVVAVADGLEAGFADLLARAEARGARVVSAPRERIDRAGDADHGSGLLASVAMPREADDDPPAGNGPRLEIALAGLQDPGNVGTLVRSAAAFGASVVHVVPGTADPFCPKALRASAGAALRPGFVLRGDGLRLAERANAGALELCAAERADVCERADGADALPRRALLVLGHETRGLPSLPGVRRVSVPQRAEVESLNVAIAGSILAAGWFARHGAPA